MAIGLAFVDIVGDTTRTEAQIERDMNRVIGEVESAIDPVEVSADVDRSQDRHLLADLNAQIADLQSRAHDLSVNPSIDELWRHDGLARLNRDIAALQAEADSIRVDVDTDHIATDLTESVREAVRIAEVAAPPVEIETRVDSDRVMRSFSGIGSAATAALGPIRALSVGLLGIGTAVPTLVGVVSALEAMAPAAAIAAPAILSIVSATAAIKIGMSGVSDATKAALDPSNPKKYAEALDKLSPSAQKFVQQIHSMQPALDTLRKSVQERLFAGLDVSLKNLSSSGLPLLQSKLGDTAGVFNGMARSVAATAAQLSKSGTLGKALDESNKGLEALTFVPAFIVQGLAQIAAAAGPSFGRLTAAAASAATGIGNDLSAAFKSGALQKSIEAGIAQVKVFGQVLGNVGTILGNVFQVANQFGGGSLGGLKALTDELVKFSASKSFTDALTAIFSTAQKVTQTALPLLGQALAAIGPVLQALLPGVNALLAVLGPALSRVIAALAPVLVAAAQAISAIAVAVAPLLTLLSQLVAAVLPILTTLLSAVVLVFNALTPVVTQVAQLFSTMLLPAINTLVSTLLPPLIALFATFIASILPVLVPLLTAVVTVFTALLPVVVQVATMLASALLPVISALVTSVLPPLLTIFTTLISAILPVFSKLLDALSPALGILSNVVVQLVQALGPLLTALAQLIGPLLSALVPILIPIIDFIGKLASVLAGTLAQFITTIVIPALNVLTSLLKGDFSGAWQAAKQVIKGFIDFTIQLFINLPITLGQLIFDLGKQLFNAAKSAFSLFNQAAINVIQNDLLPWLSGLGGKILGAVGDLGSALLNAGKSVISGLLSGIRSKLGELQSLLSSVTDLIPKWKGPADRDAVLLKPAGQSIMGGLLDGIADRLPDLQSQLQGITGMIGGTSMSLGGVGVGAASALGGTPAARFAGSANLPTGVTTAGAPSVQVFIGERELTDIVDVRVTAASRAQGRQIVNGMRR